MRPTWVPITTLSPNLDGMIWRVKRKEFKKTTNLVYRSLLSVKYFALKYVSFRKKKKTIILTVNLRENLDILYSPDDEAKAYRSCIIPIVVLYTNTVVIRINLGAFQKKKKKKRINLGDY